MRISGKSRICWNFNSWQSKAISKCLAPKIHLNLLQNIDGIVKNAQVQHNASMIKHKV
jgi:hypothetical protein